MPVRRQLLLLVFSLLLPAILACGVAVVFTYNHERQRSEDNLLRTTQALAESLDRQLDALIGRLQVLATSPSLDRPDLRAFWDQARRSTGQPGLWVVLSDRDGQQLVNTLRPFGEALPRHSPDHPFTRVQAQVTATGRPVLSDLFIGPVTGRPTLAATVPVFDAEKRVRYFLSYGIDPDVLSSTVSSISLPRDWLAAVADANVTVVARLPDIGLVGKQPVPALVQAMRSTDAGLISAVSTEGISTRVAFSRSPKYGWYFVVGVPTSGLVASVYRTLAMFGGVAALLLALGTLLAVRIGQRISGAIARLVPAARGLSTRQVPVHHPTGVTEVDAVSTALERAGLDLAASERDRARAQASLTAAKEQAERANQAKSQFLASASHDLRQPVQSLFFLHEVLAGQLRDHRSGAVVARMQGALDALKCLLDGLLEISRLHAGAITVETSVFPVSCVLERVVAENAARATASGVTLRLVGCSAWVRSDPAQLEHILRNLVDNAVKYTPKGGAVLVGCRRVGVQLRLEVVDTGPGIAAASHEAIFEEFVQLGNAERDRTKGLGLGLAIVRHLARLLGHQVTVRSGVGRGTTFSVTVPQAPSRQQAAE
jgi:signal transduction histidine kinase